MVFSLSTCFQFVIKFKPQYCIHLLYPGTVLFICFCKNNLKNNNNNKKRRNHRRCTVALVFMNEVLLLYVKKKKKNPIKGPCYITLTDRVVTTDLINAFPFLIAVDSRHFQDWHIICVVLALAHSAFTKYMQITVGPAVPGSVNTLLSECWASAVRTAAGDDPDKAPCSHMQTTH